MPRKKDLSIEDLISEENERLLKIFEKIPPKELETVKPLIQNASFLSVTLARLQKSINSGDLSEEYQNGSAQIGRKCTSELQTYNNLIKDYNSIITKLLRLLPKDPEEKTEDRFARFLRGDYTESDFDDL